MNRVRERFFQLTLRERIIAAVLLCSIGIFWAASVIGQLGKLSERFRSTASEFNFQEEILSRSDQVEASIANRLAELESQEALTAASFVEAVDGISRAVGLSPDLDPAETQSGDLVSVHELDVSFDDVAFVPLIDFIRRIQEQALPVSISEMQLSVNPRSPERVDVMMRLSGFEFDPVSATTLGTP